MPVGPPDERSPWNGDEKRDRLLVRERMVVPDEAGEDPYRALADLIPGVVWTARPDGWIDYANQFWINFTGMTREQTEGAGWTNMLHPDDVERVLQIWNKSLQTGEPVEVEYRLKRASDGVYRWFLSRGKALRDREGRVVKWFGTLTDIEDQKRLEEERARLLAREREARAEAEAAVRVLEEAREALQASEWQYRFLAEAIPQMVWTARPDGETDFLNRPWYEYTGLTPEQSQGSGWATVLHPDDRQKCFDVWAHSIQSGETFEIEYRFKRGSDGVYHWFLGRGLPVRDREGRIVKWFGTCTNIDDQKQAERLLRARDRQSALTAQIALVLNEAADLPVMAQRCCEILVEYLDAAFVRLWTLPEGEQVLHLRASAGLYTRLNGRYSRIRVGDFRVGLIAQERRPLLINQVIGDPRIPDQEWARREGMVAFAGHPLICGDRLLGVLALFTRRPLEPEVISTLAPISDAIALGIQRKHTEEELQQTKMAADRANRAKSEFLSRMSHELRTPLNVILGFTQLMGMGSSSPRQRQHLEQMFKAGRHLLGLIDEVLDLARIEAGRLQLSPEPIRVRYLFGEVLDLIRPLAQQRGIQLTVRAAFEQDLYVLADNQRLKQVLLNLVSNAVKYNREQGSVSLACEEVSPGRVRLLVCDTGPGIPPENLERLFNPFDRLGAEATGVEGTGLGLVLSKRLTEAMGGTLGVSSTVGQGSTFFVELPKTTSQKVQLAECQDPAVLTPAPANTRGRTVLYVEDNLDNLGLIEGILAYRPQVRLLSAMQGGLGLDLARQHHPDLILLDVHLPDMKGDEVLRHIYADPQLRGTPVIVISADGTPNQIERLRAAGAWEYLNKPIDVARFLTLLDRFLHEGRG